MIDPRLPLAPPSSRYADDAVYGFFLEWPPDDALGRFKVGIDQILNSKDYLQLVLNPQQVSVSEPYATSISFTQGGGKFVEGRGQLIRDITIVGTTGFLPIPAVGGVGRGLVDFTDGAEESRAERSGFKAFHDLKYMFRLFGDARRRGVQVRMHWMDFKNDEFWLVEPNPFGWRQAAPRGFLYDYSIRMIALEPSGALLAPDDPLRALLEVESRRAGGISPFSASGLLSGQLELGISSYVDNNPVRQALRRIEDLAANGRAATSLVPSAIAGACVELVGVLDEMVAAAGDVRAFPSDIRRWGDAVFGAYEAAKNRFFAEAESFATYEELSEGPLFEWNELIVEATVLVDHLRVYAIDGDEPSDVASQVSSLSEARSAGTPDDLMPETGEQLFSNPFVGASGPIVDPAKLLSAGGFRSAVVFRGDTIYDVAKRELGNPQRFVDLAIVNGLSAPYVVSSVVNKPPGTLAWGETIRIPISSSERVASGVAFVGTPAASFGGRVTSTGTSTQVVDAGKPTPWREDQWVGFTVTLTSGSGVSDPVRFVVSNDEDTLVLNRAWTISPTIGDSFTISLQEFSLRDALTPEANAYGMDALLVFYQKTGSSTRLLASPVLDARNDIAKVAGFENYVQAVRCRSMCPRGRHFFHPTYGLGLPIGDALTKDRVPAYSFFAKQGLLEDPRTESVRNVKFKATGGVAEMSLSVQPVNAHRATLLNFNL